MLSMPFFRVTVLESHVVEDACDAVNVHQLGRQGRGVRWRDGCARTEVLDEGGRNAAIVRDYAMIGEEFQGVGVRCRLGLDEDGSHTRGNGSKRWGEFR